jgi:nitrite reductase (NADH) large subunit
MDLGLQTHVVERNPRVMPRQVDALGGKLLMQKIEALGVKCHVCKDTQEILGDHGVATGVKFGSEDGEALMVDMVVFSTGIRPRDDVAIVSGIEVHPRGGIIVDDYMLTSDK